MLEIKKILFQIENNIEEVLEEKTQLGTDLWNILLEQHPADIAQLLESVEETKQIALLKKLPLELSIEVFQKIPENIQATLLVTLDIDHATELLNSMNADKLTDLFDYLSDEDLKKYLGLIQKNERTRIISLLHFDPESAGGRMNSDVFTLQKDFSVRKSIQILQRVSPEKELMQRIYVTNRDNVLVGHITIDQLVLSKPETLLSQILEKNELHVYVKEDQEDVANQMHHYELSSVPVVDKHNHFLGVITASDVVQIIKEEESEDAYKRFGLSTVERSYFATPAWKMILQRSLWLIGLLLLQSISGFVLGGYRGYLEKYTIIAVFLTMLVGTGGNAGNQSATLVIRGLTTGEITKQNVFKMLLREFGIAIIIALLIVVAGFFRVYFTADFMGAVTISIALFLIVLTSVVLGSLIPLFLEYFDIDPAHSAAPFLTTLMDILGIIIYCFVFSRILG
ncbi:MAG: magnesium transporter [bacterium]